MCISLNGHFSFLEVDDVVQVLPFVGALVICLNVLCVLVWPGGTLCPVTCTCATNEKVTSGKSSLGELNGRSSDQSLCGLLLLSHWCRRAGPSARCSARWTPGPAACRCQHSTQVPDMEAFSNRIGLTLIMHNNNHTTKRRCLRNPETRSPKKESIIQN